MKQNKYKEKASTTKILLVWMNIVIESGLLYLHWRPTRTHYIKYSTKQQSTLTITNTTNQKPTRFMR